MPFIGTPEFVGYCRGLRLGIQSLLRIRFGAEGVKLMPEVEKIYDEEHLKTIIAALETTINLDGIRPLVASDPTNPSA